jgi:Tfp pilus assembly protein PilV
VGIGDAGAANRLTVSHNINGSARISLTNPNTGTSAESFLYAITTGNRYLGILQHGQNKTGTTVGLSNASLSEIQAGGDNSSLLINQGSSTAPIVFATNNAERIRITSGGRILAATTTDNGVDALQVNGSIQANGFDQAYTVRTTTYTAATTDYFIDCTSGTFTVNLFTAVGNTGRILIIKNSGTGTITVDPNGTQTIDGATTQTLSTQWSRVHIISDGANWKIISN